MLYGIDISEHQNSNFDLTPYADGQHFVILRAGWGYGNEDKCFRTFADQCQRLGIPYGVYWYSYSVTPDGGKTEAEYMLKIISGRKISCGVWIDMEDADHYKQKNGALTQSVCTGVCKNFCDTVKAAGFHAGIYASRSWFGPQSFIRDTYGYDKWVAAWGNNDGRIHYDLSGECSVFQYCGSPLDSDVMYVPLSWFGGEDAPAPVKTVDQLADEVIRGVWGVGQQRRRALEQAGYNYDLVQRRVNEKLGAAGSPDVTDLTALALRVIQGEFGNGIARQLRLGSRYAAVQAEVNRLLLQK